LLSARKKKKKNIKNFDRGGRGKAIQGGGGGGGQSSTWKRNYPREEGGAFSRGVFLSARNFRIAELKWKNQTDGTLVEGPQHRGVRKFSVKGEGEKKPTLGVGTLVLGIKGKTPLV